MIGDLLSIKKRPRKSSPARQSPVDAFSRSSPVSIQLRATGAHYKAKKRRKKSLFHEPNRQSQRLIRGTPFVILPVAVDI